MLLAGPFPEVASIALFNMLSVSPTDIPGPAADSFEAAICCNDKAKGSKAAAAAGAAAGLGVAAAAGFDVAAAGFRFAKDGRTLPVVGLIVVGSLPKGCVPGPLAAEELEEASALSVVEVGLGAKVDAAAGLFTEGVVGETRLFFRFSAASDMDISD